VVVVAVQTPGGQVVVPARVLDDGEDRVGELDVVEVAVPQPSRHPVAEHVQDRDLDGVVQGVHRIVS
jgi:hypothetical protein